LSSDAFFGITAIPLEGAPAKQIKESQTFQKLIHQQGEAPR